MSSALLKFLREFHTRFGQLPEEIQFDDGKEFYKVGVLTLLRKRNINHFSTMSDKKAAIVERFNRKLKTAMWKYLDAKGTTRWVDVLDDLVSNHNELRHQTQLDSVEIKGCQQR
ncbi:integrase core domain-containing [Paramuricea clavata]|uniref:Integrase core domain-containing n=1 Tax=Paramuricea clavata TaxID=317549 RepID=A0A6S7HL92_PARCT|nr:integrase core domain-containing [Paramuricea clavata]